MIQGSEPALQAFTADFIQIKQQARLNTSLIQDHTDINKKPFSCKRHSKKEKNCNSLNSISHVKNEREISTPGNRCGGTKIINNVPAKRQQRLGAAYKGHDEFKTRD